MSTGDQPQAVKERRGSAIDSAVGPQVPSIGTPNELSRFTAGPSNGSRHSIELHIEELVLNGFEPAHRYAIGEAIERELTRLFTEHDTPPAITHNFETARVDGGPLPINPDSSPEVIGARVARAIYGGLHR